MYILDLYIAYMVKIIADEIAEPLALIISLLVQVYSLMI